MAALPRVPAPVRPRDFRLTPEQAAAIRPPSGLRRLLAPLAGARFAFAGPAGAGLAALGLAGILLSGGLNVQPPTLTADKSVASQAGAAGATELTGASPALLFGPADQAAPLPAGSVAPAPASSVAPVVPAPRSAAPSTALSMAASAAPAAASVGPTTITPSTATGLRPMPSATTSGTDNGTGGAVANQSAGGGVTAPPAAPLRSTEAATPSTSPLAGLGFAFVLVGLLLVGVRRAARRFA
jgi:hypothetical protein